MLEVIRLHKLKLLCGNDSSIPLTLLCGGNSVSVTFLVSLLPSHLYFNGLKSSPAAGPVWAINYISAAVYFLFYILNRISLLYFRVFIYFLQVIQVKKLK